MDIVDCSGVRLQEENQREEKKSRKKTGNAPIHSEKQSFPIKYSILGFRLNIWKYELFVKDF